MRKLCKRCGKAKSLTAFPAGQAVCKVCRREDLRRSYYNRVLKQGDFVCRSCGKEKTAEQASRAAKDLCKACYAEATLKKKAAAPEVLVCRTCGKSKPKAEFEKYSLTRCSECRAKLAKLKKEADKWGKCQRKF